MPSIASASKRIASKLPRRRFNLTPAKPPPPPPGSAPPSTHPSKLKSKLSNSRDAFRPPTFSPSSDPESSTFTPTERTRIKEYQKKITPTSLRPGEVRVVPSVVYEDEKYLVLNKRSRIAIQGDFGSSARIGWDQTLSGQFSWTSC